MSDNLGLPSAAAIIDLRPRLLDRHLAATDASQLHVADDRGRVRIEDGGRLYNPALDKDRRLAGDLRSVGAGRYIGALILAGGGEAHRSEEHTSELQSLMRISYAV